MVGISGRLVRWKRQDALLRAVALLAAEDRDVHALVVGGDSHNEDPGYGGELERLAASLGIADRVTFTGHRTDAVALTQVMDVMVNASDPEPFGLVLLEALAVRRPVVAVARGGPAEIVEDGVTGTLVPDPATGAAGRRPPAARRRSGAARPHGGGRPRAGCLRASRSSASCTRCAPGSTASSAADPAAR